MAINLSDIRKRQKTQSEYERSRDLTESEGDIMDIKEIPIEEIKFEYEFEKNGQVFDGQNIFVGMLTL